MLATTVRCFALATCNMLLASSALAAQPALPPALERQVQQILKAGKVSGVAVVLVDGLGVSGALWHGNVSGSTCDHTGEASSAFVALAAMRLTERGKIDLYAGLPDALRSPANLNKPRSCKTKVTLGHLLEHTSGMDSASQQLLACPGVSTSYSSAGLALAALALEKTTRTAMATLVQREVFNPLAMHGSSWGKPPPACTSAVPATATATATINGVFTTPLDMANVVQMFVLRGQIDAKTYLPQCAVERMGISISAISMPGGNTPQALAQAKQGLGLERFGSGVAQWLGSSGDAPDARWVWAYSSKTQSGMVIMVNAPDAKTLAALRSAVSSYLQRDDALLARR